MAEKCFNDIFLKRNFMTSNFKLYFILYILDGIENLMREIDTLL